MFGMKDQRWLLCGVFSALFVMAISPEGFASSGEENTVRLAWVRGAGAESCPGEATVANFVAARLGRNPFSEESGWFIEGVVERSAAGWSTHIRMSNGGTNLGIRELSSETSDCSAITAASVLAIAVGIDPDAALMPAPNPEPAAQIVPAKPETPRPTKEASGPVVVPSVAKVPSVQPLRVAPFPRLTVSSRGVVGIALLPRVAPGFAIVAGLEGRFWEATSGMLWLPEVVTTNRDFAFGITAVSLGGCVNPIRVRRLSLAGCLALYGGGIHQVVAALQGEYEPRDVRQKGWFAAAPSLRARVHVVSRLSVDAGVEFVIPLQRHDFAVGGRSDLAFGMEPLGLMTFFGPTLSIP